MIRKPVLVALVAVGLGLTTMAAWANDTDLTYGGTPLPLKGNTTVSMQREYVKIDVGDDYVTVDCRFTFHNDGPSLKVRIGFPDEGGEPDEEPGAPSKPPRGTFMRFNSWVNGQPVKTTVVSGAYPGDVWHVKEVAFPANSTLNVRDRYLVEIGDSVAYYPAFVRLARYVLHTGSSWHGPIGRSEVEVQFTKKSIHTPIVAKRLPVTDDRSAQVAALHTSSRAVYFSGPCRPRASGRTLRFVRTDWRPTEKDDILLLFDVQRPASGGKS
jgi:hypothetical protein